MSSDSVVYNCATCSKIIDGRQNFAICILCQRRVHRMCYHDRLSNDRWAKFRQTFTCSTCKAGMAAVISRPEDAEEPVQVLASQSQHFNTNVSPITIRYEIMIGASQKSGDIVSDGCGYTYRFSRDYPSLRVWRCTFRGCVKFPRCNSTLKQIKRPGVDFLRTYFQEDFTLDADKPHSHPPLNGVDTQTVRQSSATITETLLNLGNFSTSESAQVSADVRVSIDYQDTHVSNSGVTTAKRKRCPVQRQDNKKQSIAFSIDELFGDNR